MPEIKPDRTDLMLNRTCECGSKQHALGRAVAMAELITVDGPFPGKKEGDNTSDEEDADPTNTEEPNDEEW